MKLRDELRKREYRVLAIAIAFFAVGLFFFLSDRPWTPAPAAPSTNVAPQQVASVQSPEPLSPSLQDYPSPSQFRTFAVADDLINGTSSFMVSSTCADAYTVVLVFPSAADYRETPDRAVYNRAFPCAAQGDVVDTVIAPADLGNVPTGTYYYFTADQGTSSIWYNPK